jgi:AcrR family transcriptional regulator
MVYRRTENVVGRMAARRQSLVRSATALAAQGGMAAVQIVPVAERAGIAAGTVYRYFPSKTDLVAAVVDAVAESELAALRRAAAAAPGPLSALSTGIATFAARSILRRRLAWSVLAEPVAPQIDGLRVAYRSALTAQFATALEGVMNEGHIPQQDISFAAPALVGCLIEGLIGPMAPEVDTARTLRQSVQSMTLFALRALGIPDARARGLVVQASIPDEVEDLD